MNTQFNQMNMNNLPFFLALLLIITGLFNQPENDDAATIQNLLEEFLEGASMNDPKMHDRFWADDLIYTSAAGERITKQDIMSGLRTDADSLHAVNIPVYSAQDVQINLYGETAVVAFRLVADFPHENGDLEQLQFYNTGTFVKQIGQWRAVAWQATSITNL